MRCMQFHVKTGHIYYNYGIYITLNIKVTWWRMSTRARVAHVCTLLRNRFKLFMQRTALTWDTGIGHIFTHMRYATWESQIVKIFSAKKKRNNKSIKWISYLFYSLSFQVAPMSIRKLNAWVCIVLYGLYNRFYDFFTTHCRQNNTWDRINRYPFFLVAI